MKSKELRIYCDTNLVVGNPIQIGLLGIIEECKKLKSIDVTFILSEVVKEEVVKNITLERKKNVKSHNSIINDLKPYLELEKIHITTDKIKKIIEQSLEQHNFEILPITLSDHNLNMLIKKAVWYEPPFEASREKGFKDSIIGDSYIADIQKYDQEHCIVYSKDNNLSKYITMQLPEVLIISGVDDLQSTIKFKEERISSAQIEKLTNTAEILFGDPKHPEDGLFVKNNIEGKIRQAFSWELTNPLLAEDVNFSTGNPVSFSADNFIETYGEIVSNNLHNIPLDAVFRPMKPTDVSVSTPAFVRVSKKRYYWMTFVVFKNEYLVKDSRDGMLGLREWYLIHEVSFKVDWNVEVNYNGTKPKFTSPKIGKISLGYNQRTSRITSTSSYAQNSLESTFTSASGLATTSLPSHYGTTNPTGSFTIDDDWIRTTKDPTGILSLDKLMGTNKEENNDKKQSK